MLDKTNPLIACRQRPKDSLLVCHQPTNCQPIVELDRDGLDSRGLSRHDGFSSGMLIAETALNSIN